VVNFGTVFVDQSYWQSAIASKPSAAVKAFLLGGLVWFAIPFTLATSLGLAGVALGLELPEYKVRQGIVGPLVVELLLGKAGALGFLLMLFMAVVSTGAPDRGHLIARLPYRPPSVLTFRVVCRMCACGWAGVVNRCGRVHGRVVVDHVRHFPLLHQARGLADGDAAGTAQASS
jgi:hypothetical protein